MFHVGFFANYIRTEYASLASNSDDEQEIINKKKMNTGGPKENNKVKENDKAFHPCIDGVTSIETKNYI
jgi:hypothetical protein